MPTASAPALISKPPLRIYETEKELAHALQQSKRYTTVRDVITLDQLVMAMDGTLKGGLRYTAQGLKQVLSLACARSYEVVSDLAGISLRLTTEPAEPNDAAINVYNLIVRQRFKRFSNKIRLIINQQDRQIEGVMGPRYELLENSDLLERAAAAVAAGARPCRFHSAIVAGRRMTLRYVHRRALITTKSDEFVGGYHFSNSELGGEATVRAAVLLCRCSDDSFALDRFVGGKLVHTGKNFVKKLTKLFGTVAATEQDAKKLTTAMLSLSELKLSTADINPAREAKLVSAIYHAGVPKTAAVRVVQHALFYGSSPVASGFSVPPNRQTLAGRTGYDLYNSLTYTAKKLHANSREVLEQTAYALLLGKVSL